jgi:hypothetical protein
MLTLSGVEGSGVEGSGVEGSAVEGSAVEGSGAKNLSSPLPFAPLPHPRLPTSSLQGRHSERSEESLLTRARPRRRPRKIQRPQAHYTRKSLCRGGRHPRPHANWPAMAQAPRHRFAARGNSQMRRPAVGPLPVVRLRGHAEPRPRRHSERSEESLLAPVGRAFWQPALRANAILRRAGSRFWQDESFDHWVRSGAQLQRIKLYIEWNPVKAGLVARPQDWPWSSASSP